MIPTYWERLENCLPEIDVEIEYTPEEYDSGYRMPESFEIIDIMIEGYRLPLGVQRTLIDKYEVDFMEEIEEKFYKRIEDQADRISEYLAEEYYKWRR